MSTWIFIIKYAGGTIITKNQKYADKKRKLGCIVFCKCENNIYKFNK